MEDLQPRTAANDQSVVSDNRRYRLEVDKEDEEEGERTRC